jgi:hypothetical protein
MNWTQKDLDNLKSKGLNVQGLKTNTSEQKKSKVKIPKLEPKGLSYMKNYLKIMKIEFVTELVFHPDRKWRFDIAIPKMKCAVEYEGLISNKSGHTTIDGYTKDTEKYNQAQKLGWKVLRYTVKNYKDFINDFEYLKTK